MALLRCSKIQVYKAYSGVVNIVAISRQDDITKEKWMEMLQNLQEEDIELSSLETSR
ncbi:hypothetical protein Gotri_025441 [Gossypium trilobum]|uniref:Uncharacterized protein n=1 Tax=Gossypium trilobum TaxID=34281 RepID=A0A7J9FMA5_9ROSI|nr:hypothetical protein [Gossypium trilobum]